MYVKALDKQYCLAPLFILVVIKIQFVYIV